MSSSIWTQCAGDSSVRALHLAPWRAVEAQHQLSTRKLVSSAEEQMLLEDLIERVKPPAVAASRQHYLHTTPFRYPPLHHGSRFGSRHERGIWYGSESLRTAFAEVAYYRMVFMEGTSAELGDITTQLTAFRSKAVTPHGVDLAAPPFSAHREEIASAVSYIFTQQLGNTMRGKGVELVRYPSAREPDGVNVAAFTPTVFGAARPRDLQTWHCIASREKVELAKQSYFGAELFTFLRSQFLVAGLLPAPAI